MQPVTSKHEANMLTCKRPRLLKRITLGYAYYIAGSQRKDTYDMYRVPLPAIPYQSTLVQSYRLSQAEFKLLGVVMRMDVRPRSCKGPWKPFQRCLKLPCRTGGSACGSGAAWQVSLMRC